MRNLCDKMFFWIVFKMIITVWALFRQSLPCQHVAARPLQPLPVSTSCAPFFIFRFSQAGVGVDSAVTPLPSSHVHCLSLHHHSHGCGRPPVLTPIHDELVHPVWSGNCAAAHHASSFDLLCYSFCKCAFSFCCCGVFSFDLIFHVISCVMYFIFFFGDGFFL